jgi:hypothetical protein
MRVFKQYQFIDDRKNMASSLKTALKSSTEKHYGGICKVENRAACPYLETCFWRYCIDMPVLGHTQA